MADRGTGIVSAPKPMSVGSQLCTQCGLCCTGALHDTASAEPDELEALRSGGMTIVKDGEKYRFSMPCAYLRGTSCSTYGRRPRVCSRYRCRLLRDVEAGAAEVSDALIKVREARRLFEAVVQLLPPGMTLPEARALTRNPGIAPKSMSVDRYPQLVLQVLVLMRYLDLHFRHAEEGPVLREEVLTMGGSTESFSKVSEQHV